MATYTIATSLPNNSSLFDVFTKSGAGVGLTSFSITNSDGTVTTFNGTNLTWNGNTATAGTVTSIVRTNAALTVVFDQITDFSAGVNDSFTTIWNPTPTAQAARAGYIFSGADSFIGTTGNDFFRGYNGADTFTGNTGNDQVGYENDAVTPGGAGTGAVIVNMSSTTKMGVAANSARDGFGTIDTLISIEEARGTANADFFFGSTAYNLFSGRQGADTYDGGNSVAFLKGFAGTSWNWVDYRVESGITGATDGINITLTNGTATPGVDGVGDTGGTGTDPFGATETFTNINAIRGGNNPALTDVVTGNDFFNYFEGLSGIDIFDGKGGSDRYSYANEARFGGSTTRGVLVNLSDDAVTLNGVSVAAHTGIDTFGAFGFVDQLINVEEINGTNQADFVQGNQFDNKIFLLGGNDEVWLGRGFDYVEPGAGDDIIHGEAEPGLDQSYADRDEVSYDDFGSNGVGVYIDLNANTLVDPTGGIDTIYDIERLRGTSSADTLIGSDFANQREELYRGLGGNDIIDGRNGFDVADYAQDANNGGTAGIIANLSNAAITVGAFTVQAGTVRDGFGSTDTLFYIEGIRGTASDDTMVGNDGNNHFRGNGGNDTIDGGGGIDEFDLFFGDVFTGLGGIVNLSDTDFVFAGHTVAAHTARQFDGGIATLISIEVATGSSADDAINGSDGRENLQGRFGNDTIFGNGGNDIINGGPGANTLDGGDGFDTVSFVYDKTWGDYHVENFPGQGFVTWTGVTVNLGTNSAIGFDGQINTVSNFEAVAGTFVDDDITGDDNDNVFRGLSGNDRMDGAGGNDTANYSPTNQDGRILVPIKGVNYSEPNVVRVNLTAGDLTLGGELVAAGTAQDGEGGIDTLISIENVTGSIGGDFIAASDVANVIDGWLGDDVVFYAGVESDYTITAINGGWQVTRNASPTDVDILRNVETLSFLGGGTRTLAAQGLTETGDADSNEITGVQGDDTIDGGGGEDFIDGGQGADNLQGGSGADELIGGDGDDVVDGGDDDDTIVGGSGLGDDIYIGGAGIDTAVYTSATVGIVVDLDTGSGSGTATGPEIGTDQLIGIENIVGGQGDDSITGDGVDNVLTGVAGSDQVFGEGGNDTLHGGSGNDVLVGGADDDQLYGDSDDDVLRGGPGSDYLDGGANSLTGGDTADFSDATGSVVAALGEDGDAVVTAAGIGTDTLIRIENLLGGDFADILTGNGSANQLTGGAGADELRGGGGDDILNADADDTVVDGGDGIDTVNLIGNGITFNLDSRHIEKANGTAGDDVIDGSTGTTGALTLNGLGGSDLLSGGSEGDTINGGDGDDAGLYGNGGNDTISGGAGIDYIEGGDGDDAIFGGDDNDTIYGGAGADTIDGGAANEYAFGGNDNDTMVGGTGTDYLVGDDNVIANTGITGDDTLFGGDDNDTLIGGYGSDTLNGEDGNDALYGDFDDVEPPASNPGAADTLKGGAGEDFMFGGGGNDILIGGADNDTLIGGSGDDILQGDGGSDALYGRDGVDTFVFTDDWGTDGVWDFAVGSEKFDMTAVTGLDTFGQLTIDDRVTPENLAYADIEFNGNHIFVVGVSKAELTTDNFLL